MLFATVKAETRRLLQAFRDERGGIAVWFGIAMPFIAVGSLGVVDYGAASMNKQTIQDALDDAALVAARSTGITSAAIDATGDAAFRAIMPTNTNLSGFTPDAGGHIANVTFTLNGTSVVADATGTYSPIVSHLLIGGPIPVHAHSQVERGQSRLEIAMVLDTTGSMEGTKLSNLISAAKGFITDMQTVAASSTLTNPVKISIVPFAMTVKVNSALSLSSYNNSTHAMSSLPTWLDGRARSIPWNKDIFTIANSSSARIDRFTLLKQMSKSWSGCVEARAAPYDIRDTAPTSSDVNTLFTPYFWPDEPDTSTHYQNDYLNDISTGQWDDRQGYSGKYNTSSFKNTGQIPGMDYNFGPNAGCEMQGLMRLSTNFDALRSQIDGLVAEGDTDVPLGLMWGWHTLSPNAPFADGSAYGTQGVTKVVVLMTDGDNTYGTVNSSNKNDSLYEGYGYIWQNKLGTTDIDDAPGKINDRFVPPSGNPSAESLCGNIKAKSIQIYTVGVGVSTASKTLLKACATDADHYYDVNSSASNLDDAFKAIAGSIQALRISR